MHPGRRRTRHWRVSPDVARRTSATYPERQAELIDRTDAQAPVEAVDLLVALSGDYSQLRRSLECVRADADTGGCRFLPIEAKMMGRNEFTLPKSFRAEDYLPSQLLTRADDARWLLSTIVRKTAHKDVDHWGCVRLHTRVLRRVMAPNTIAAIVNALGGRRGHRDDALLPWRQMQGVSARQTFPG